MYDQVLADNRSHELTAHSSGLLSSTRNSAHVVTTPRLELRAAVMSDGASAGRAPAESSVEGDVIDSIAALIEAVTHALAGDGESARRSIEMAGLSLARGLCNNSHISSRARVDDIAQCRGGLAPWQVRRLTTHIENNLAESVQCEDLAQLVNLSISHFMRAFRESFGCPPHAYLLRRRIECAQGLMLTTTTPLGQIAIECGLADQSHLSRLFQKFVGETPAAWRRARVHSTTG